MDIPKLQEAFLEALVCGPEELSNKKLGTICDSNLRFLQMRIDGDLPAYQDFGRFKELRWDTSDEYYELLVAYTLYKHAVGDARRLGNK